MQLGSAQEAAKPETVAPETKPPAPDPRLQVATDIRSLVEQIQLLREQQRSAAEAQQDEVDSLKLQVSTLLQQVTSTEESVRVQNQEIADTETQLQANQQEVAQQEAWIGHTVQAVLPVALEIRQRVAQGTGENLGKRLAACDEALAALETKNNQEQQALGVRNFFQALGGEWLAARNVTLANEALELQAGKQLSHAWVLRLGTAGQVFLSEDQRTFGVWANDPQNPWKTDIQPEYQQQILELFEVVREQRPPGLVPLPVWLTGKTAGKTLQTTTLPPQANEGQK